MKIKLAIALPLYNDREYSQFWDSFLVMQKPDYVFLRPDYPGRIDIIRNNLVTMALEHGCTHLLFADTDQIYPTNTIPKLFETLEVCRCKVAGTIVYRRYVPFDPLVFYGSDPLHLEKIPDEALTSQEFLKVDATGAGCILYNLDVFRSIPKPWFEDKSLEFYDEEKKKFGPGEDIGFCFKLKEAGFDIWVNTSLDIGHLCMLNVNRGFYKLFRLMQKACTTESKKS